jgi:uncharacterized membrane protein YphA (DoxX/SURF4 family)
MGKLKEQAIVIWGLRISLALAFFSAVADRVGIWGAAGAEGVVWGNFENFIAYTKLMNPWFPDFLISPISYLVTILEVILGRLLLAPFRTREVAFASGLLILSFGLAMILSFGFKPTFDYSVFSACFACFALSALVSKKI